MPARDFLYDPLVRDRCREYAAWGPGSEVVFEIPTFQKLKVRRFDVIKTAVPIAAVFGGGVYVLSIGTTAGYIVGGILAGVGTIWGVALIAVLALRDSHPLAVDSEFVEFGGERIYYRDVQRLSEWRDKSGTEWALHYVDVGTESGTKRLDLQEYFKDPVDGHAVFQEIERHWDAAHGRSW